MTRSSSDTEYRCAAALKASLTTVQLEDLRPRERYKLHEHAAAVLEVSHPAHEPCAVEAIEEERHRPAADPGEIGQSSGGRRAVLVEQVHAPHVGSIQPEHVPECLFKSVRG